MFPRSLVRTALLVSALVGSGCGTAIADELLAGGDEDPTPGFMAGVRGAVRRLPTELPDVTYTYQGGGEPVARAGWFDPLLDTPAFGNRGTGLSAGGTCFGISLLTATWYQTFVHPLKREARDPNLIQRILPFLPRDQAPQTVEGELGVEAQVTRDNLEKYRLRAYSHASQEQRIHAVRLAVTLHDDQRLPGHHRREGARKLRDHLLDELDEEDLGVSYVFFRNLDHSVGHGILAVSAERGKAKASNGREVEVIQFRLFDPNRVETAANTATTRVEQSLLWFVEAERMGFAAPYLDRYRSWEIQDGPFLEDENVGYRDLFGGAARMARALHGQAQGDRTEGREDDEFDWPDLSGGPVRIAGAAVGAGARIPTPPRDEEGPGLLGQGGVD